MNEAIEAVVAAAAELGEGTHTVGNYRVIINGSGEVISITRR